MPSFSCLPQARRAKGSTKIEPKHKLNITYHHNLHPHTCRYEHLHTCRYPDMHLFTRAHRHIRTDPHTCTYPDMHIFFSHAHLSLSLFLSLFLSLVLSLSLSLSLMPYQVCPLELAMRKRHKVSRLKQRDRGTVIVYERKCCFGNRKRAASRTKTPAQ